MALPGFESLGNSLWLSQATSAEDLATTNPANDSIGLVIVCAWMGAAPKHIAKYTAQHRLLFPAAQILVLQSEPLDVAWRSDNSQIKRFAPARAIIRAFTSEGTRGSQHILLHSFSNGGAQTACQLATQIRSETGEVLPLRASILDSSPGGATLSRGVTAFAASLPKNGPLRWLGMALIYVALCSLLLSIWMMGKEGFFDQIRRRLNDPSLFDPKAPRLYMYSKTDKLVAWQDVEDHAVNAKLADFDVRAELFDGSEHVAHAMSDKGRYWDKVKELCQS